MGWFGLLKILKIYNATWTQKIGKKFQPNDDSSYNQIFQKKAFIVKKFWNQALLDISQNLA